MLKSRLTLVTLLMVTCLSEAQSIGARFGSLPLEAQERISAILSNRFFASDWSQLGKLTASDGQQSDQLGFSIAISGETVVVGTQGYNGRYEAYVFVKPSSGWANMTQTAILKPSDPQNAYGFGYCVGISGNTIVIGALGQRGASPAYVYVRPSNGWKDTTEIAKLTTQSAGIYELAISGNTLVVSSAANAGVSYVYVRPEHGWKSTSQPNATLTTPFYGAFCQFCVGVSGDTIAVGTPGSFGSEGTVYVFVRPSGGWSGNLSPTATLVASNGKFSDQLGISVAVSGGTIVAGANGDNNYAGALYVFVKPAKGWKSAAQTAELTAPNTLDMGWSVAVDGNSIVGGAFLTTVGTNQFQGAAYIYTRPKGGWKSTNKFAAELSSNDGMPGDEFGASVGVSGNTVTAGAPNAMIGSNTYQGAAYVFEK